MGGKKRIGGLLIKVERWRGGEVERGSGEETSERGQKRIKSTKGVPSFV